MVKAQTQPTMTPEIEHAMQFALNDLLNNNKAPDEKDISVLPLGELREIIDSLTKALPSGEIRVRKVFTALIQDNPWLSALRTKKLPPRPDGTSQTANQEPQETYAGTLLCDVVAKEVDWLWYPRLPRGKLVMWDGDPGIGKTSTLIDICARLTSGSDMPDGAKIKEKRGVVLISLEDGLEDTIAPRASRANADLKLISYLGYIKEKSADGTEYERPFSIQEDISKLEREIERINAVLVVIDPIMAVLGNKDTYRDNEVRLALSPLKSLADKTGVCIVMVRHLAKGGYDKLIYMGGGSIGFVGLSRVGMFSVKHPDEENMFILANPKNNLIKNAPMLKYSIESDENDKRAHVVWHGVIEMSEQELIRKFKGGQEDTSVQGEMRQNLLQCLRKKFPEPMAVKEIAEELEYEKDDIPTITTTLGRMVKSGQIERIRKGEYVAYGPVPSDDLSS